VDAAPGLSARAATTRVPAAVAMAVSAHPDAILEGGALEQSGERRAALPCPCYDGSFY